VCCEVARSTIHQVHAVCLSLQALPILFGHARQVSCGGALSFLAVDALSLWGSPEGFSPLVVHRAMKMWSGAPLALSMPHVAPEALPA
jgi:hypothetical protein